MQRGREYQQPKLTDVDQIKQNFVKHLLDAEQGSIRREESIDHTKILKLAVTNNPELQKIAIATSRKLDDVNYQNAHRDNESLRWELQRALMKGEALRDNEAIDNRTFDELTAINKLAEEGKSHQSETPQIQPPEIPLRKDFFTQIGNFTRRVVGKGN